MSLAKLIHKFPIDSAAPYNHRHLHPSSSPASSPVNVNLVHPSSNCNERSLVRTRGGYPFISHEWHHNYLSLLGERRSRARPSLVVVGEDATKQQLSGVLLALSSTTTTSSASTTAQPSHGPWMGCLPQLLCRTSFISHGGVGNGMHYSLLTCCLVRPGPKHHKPMALEVMCK